MSVIFVCEQNAFQMTVEKRSALINSVIVDENLLTVPEGLDKKNSFSMDYCIDNGWT